MKSPFKNLDAIQLVGFLVSAFVSIVLLVAQQDTLTSLTLGFVLAALTQLFDIQKRLTDAEERLLQANALNRALYRDEWLLKHIQQIVENYQAVKAGWFDLFKRRADDSVVECRDLLHSMAEKYLITQVRSPYAFGADAFTKAKKHVKATQAADVSYWRSNYAEKYFQANVAAIQRGVKVTRVFIQPKTVLQGIVDLLEKQQKAGIEIYVVEPEGLPRELYEDYLIVDDRAFTRLELTGDGQAREERISIDDVEIERMVKRFDMLLRHAKKLDEVIGRLKTP